MLRLFAIAPHPREIRKRSELKSSVQRAEEIVLVTRQNITRLQTLERARQARARIRQRHTENCEIDRVVRRQLRRCSTRIDINTLAANFDEKCQRFATDPVRRTLRRARTVRFRLIERHLAKKAIMRSRQHANFPWPNASHISRCHRIALFWRYACVRQPPDKVDGRVRSNKTRLRFRHYNRKLEQKIDIA